MQWSQNVRGKLLAPLLQILGDRGIRAGHITLLSLLSGLAFCPLFITGQYLPAFGFLFLHVLLDGLDGPLARYLNRASDRGSFTDTVADQVVVSATIITMIFCGAAGAWPGGIYLFLYTIVVAFAMVRSALEAPYSWLFRPRFLIFTWYAVEVFWWKNSLDYVLWTAAALLGLKAFTGFIAIQRKI